MTVRVLCPEGHPVLIAAGKIGGAAICPRCFAPFIPQSPDDFSCQARKEERKSRRARDEDDEEEEEDDEEEEEEEEEEPRRKKKPVARDDEEYDDEPDDEEAIRWNPRKRQLNIVNNGLMAYQVSFYIMIVMFILLALMEVPWVVFLVLALFGGDMLMANFIMYCMAIVAAVGAAPIYICHLIAWVAGIFAPAKSETRGLCITAIIVFLSPILFFTVYLIFTFFVLQEERGVAVSYNLLNMVTGFSFLFELAAFYISLIHIGAVAGFMGQSMDKHKPQALAWFIVGGSLIFTVCMVVILFVPWWALYIVAVFTFNTYYFIISSMAELIGVVKRTRKAITEYIKNG